MSSSHFWLQKNRQKAFQATEKQGGHSILLKIPWGNTIYLINVFSQYIKKEQNHKNLQKNGSKIINNSLYMEKNKVHRRRMEGEKIT